jgi:hypothetical protein
MRPKDNRTVRNSPHMYVPNIEKDGLCTVCKGIGETMDIGMLLGDCKLCQGTGKAPVKSDSELRKPLPLAKKRKNDDYTQVGQESAI